MMLLCITKWTISKNKLNLTRMDTYEPGEKTEKFDLQIK